MIFHMKKEEFEEKLNIFLLKYIYIYKVGELYSALQSGNLFTTI